MWHIVVSRIVTIRDPGDLRMNATQPLDDEPLMQLVSVA